ncbi:hypothetical protein N9933_01460 [bacterium]|nr:hypothetical protein [bacterium]
MSTGQNTINWIGAGLIGVFFIAGIYIIYDGTRSVKTEAQSPHSSTTDDRMGVDSQAVAIETMDTNGATGTFEANPVEVSPAAITESRGLTPREAKSDKDGKSDNAAKENFATKGDLSLLDTLKGKPAHSAPVPSPTARISKPAATSPKPAVTRWHLVYGSYSTQDVANVVLKQLKDPSYTPTLLKPPSGKDGPYRISIFNNTERKKVEAFQGTYKGSTGNDTWILKGK